MKKLEYQALKNLGLSEKALTVYGESDFEIIEINDTFEVRINGDKVSFYTIEDVNDYLEIFAEEIEINALEKMRDLTDLYALENDGDYLTENTGRDGNTYLWYTDKNQNIAINVETLETLSQEQIEELLEA